MADPLNALGFCSWGLLGEGEGEFVYVLDLGVDVILEEYLSEVVMAELAVQVSMEESIVAVTLEDEEVGVELKEGGS